MKSGEAGYRARAVTDASCITRPGGMAPADICGASATHCRSTLATNRSSALATNRSSALAMDRRGALAMNCPSALRMHRCLARPVSVAYEPAEVEPVIARNFTPALPALMLRNNVVEALASGVGQ